MMAMSTVRDGLQGSSEGNDDALHVTGSRIQLPQWLLVYLLGQLVGGVWWAATLQSDVRHLERDNTKLWQKVETHDLQLGLLDKTVRTAVKEAMQDTDYIRLKRKGE